MNKVIYDNNCSLCIKIKIVVQSLDYFCLFEWIPSSTHKTDKLVTREMLDSTIVLIAKNKILTEFAACRYILSRIPIFFPFLFLLYIPFFSNFFGTKFYKFVARKRKCYN